MTPIETSLSRQIYQITSFRDCQVVTQLRMAAASLDEAAATFCNAPTANALRRLNSAWAYANRLYLTAGGAHDDTEFRRLTEKAAPPREEQPVPPADSEPIQSA